MDINPPYTLCPSSIFFHDWGGKKGLSFGVYISLIFSLFFILSWLVTISDYQWNPRLFRLHSPQLLRSSPPLQCVLSLHPHPRYPLPAPTCRATPFTPPPRALVMPPMLESAVLISPLRVRAHVLRSHVGVHVCERVCPSKACQGNGPCVHRLRAVDTVPHCNCEAQLWQVAGGRGAEVRSRGPSCPRLSRDMSAYRT